ncbi:MAG: tRNA lysidine(34) synthetase TilS [Parcubacteria group bacterium]
MRRSPLEESFNSSLFERAATVVVAVSGGADSMVLLELLAGLSKSLGLQLHVAHVNYGLRGVASKLDENLVRRRTRELGLYLHLHRTDEVRREQGNLEERARQVRYQFFTEVAREVGANVIALGHNLDDQVETLLLRVLRGSGLKGLSGMQARQGLLVRPLLAIPRANIRVYAHERGIPHREDASNRDLRFGRNRVRHILLPLLERYFNPGIRETLAQSAKVVAEDERFLDELCAKLYGKLVKEQPSPQGTIVSIASTELTDLPPALQRRLVRTMSQTALPQLRPAHSIALDQALKTLAASPDGLLLQLGEQLTLTRRRGTVRISRNT